MAVKITKEEDGTYTVRVWAEHKDVFGKRRSKYKSGIKTASVAHNKAVEFQAELDEGEEYKEYTFVEICDIYAEAKKDKKSPTTLASEKLVMNGLKKYFKNIKARKMNSRIVQDYINFLARTPLKTNKNKKHSRGSQEKAFNTIRAVLNWAVRFNYLEYHKVGTVDFVEDDEPYDPTYIEPNKVAELLIHIKKCYNEIYIPTLLCSLLGLRRSEALGLKWGNINFDNDTIWIRSTITFVNGKRVERNKTKTSSSRRILTMPNLLKQELLNHYEIIKPLKSEYVCMSFWNGEVPSPQIVTRNFIRAAKDKDLDATLKDLRFSLSQTLNDEESVDLFTQADILGHSNLATTKKHYTRQSLKKTKSALDTIAEKILSSSAKD